MSFTVDDLITIIGRQTLQIIMLEAELAAKATPVEHKPLSNKDKDDVLKEFN